MKKYLVIVIILGIFLSIDENISFAQWISPGKLSNVHKRLEGITNCLKCHSLAGGIDDSACMACHEELNKRVKEKKDFHSRLKGTCIECHTDHKGETYDITILDKEKFEHETTGYKLQDKHRRPCGECHIKETTYIGLSPECGKCHTDVHRKTLPEDCSACHNFKGWKNLTFNHVEDAAYPLTGKHSAINCESCHPEYLFEDTTRDTKRVYHVLMYKPLKHDSCNDCHYDVHEGQFKKQGCDACHSLKNPWNEYVFSHDSEEYRGYKLEGKHKAVDCDKCHERSEIRYVEFNEKKKRVISKFKPLKSEGCDDCHQAEHKGKFKEISKMEEGSCDKCHFIDREWKEFTYEHKSDSKYHRYDPTGQFTESTCNKCHLCESDVFCITCCFQNMGLTPDAE
jgi:hypothetical protein